MNSSNYWTPDLAPKARRITVAARDCRVVCKVLKRPATIDSIDISSWGDVRECVIITAEGERKLTRRRGETWRDVFREVGRLEAGTRIRLLVANKTHVERQIRVRLKYRSVRTARTNRGFYSRRRERRSSGTSKPVEASKRKRRERRLPSHAGRARDVRRRQLRSIGTSRRRQSTPVGRRSAAARADADPPRRREPLRARERQRKRVIPFVASASIARRRRGSSSTRGPP